MIGLVGDLVVELFGHVQEPHLHAHLFLFLNVLIGRLIGLGGVDGMGMGVSYGCAGWVGVRGTPTGHTRGPPAHTHTSKMVDGWIPNRSTTAPTTITTTTKSQSHFHLPYAAPLPLGGGWPRRPRGHGGGQYPQWGGLRWVLMCGWRRRRRVGGGGGGRGGGGRRRLPSVVVVCCGVCWLQQQESVGVGDG